jgi:hypothetical protein
MTSNVSAHQQRRYRAKAGQSDGGEFRSDGDVGGLA